MREGKFRRGSSGRRLWRGATLAGATVAAVASTAVIAYALVNGISQNDQAGPGPDTIVYNGKITTEDPANPEVQAIAIRNGDIVAVGDNGPIRALASQRTKLIDVKGHRVVPGLIDGHLHGMRESYHCWTQGVRLDLITTRAKALQMYAAKGDQLADGRWIWTGSGGWSRTQLTDNNAPFTFAELTQAMPKNPAWIMGGGIAGPLVNQATLDTLHLTLTSPNVVQNADGSVRLTDASTGVGPSSDANRAILAQLDQLGVDGEAQCLADFIKEANSRGLTGWKDAMGNTAPWATTGSINQGLHVDEATRQLYENGQLNARIAYNNMADAYGANPLPHELAALENAIGFEGDDMLRYLGPGEDMMATQPGTIYPDYAKFAAGKRLSVETHVGGPIPAILDGMEAADAVARANGTSIGKLEWKIAHPNPGEPSDTDLNRAKALGVGWSLTFSATRTGQTGPRYRSTMLNSAHMCLATDAMNVAAWAPFQMIWMVTTGKTLVRDADGNTLPGVPVGERLTLAEALEHYTSACGWFLHQDGRLGRLAPGYHADLVVLDKDYFAVEPDEIKDLMSVLTIVGGRTVYSDGTLDVPPSAQNTVLGDVGGAVQPTLSLSLGTPATIGPFAPGQGKDYTGTTTATVISTAGDGKLSVADPAATNTGHLVNGAFALPQALQAKASSPKGAGGDYAAVGGSSAPTQLLTYGGPVSNDAVTVGFKQTIGATDALRTGTYAKTLTFTLSTTTP
jgi:predicted amidohydrolase YtcJ